MPQNLDVVAQYGHAKLPGAKHWAIVVITNRENMKGIAFQVTRSTNTYEVKQPEEVELLYSTVTAYMGNIKVGTVYRDYAFGEENTALLAIIQHTPVVRGNRNWNCQHCSCLEAFERCSAQYLGRDIHRGTPGPICSGPKRGYTIVACMYFLILRSTLKRGSVQPAHLVVPKINVRGLKEQLNKFGPTLIELDHTVLRHLHGL